MTDERDDPTPGAEPVQLEPQLPAIPAKRNVAVDEERGYIIPKDIDQAFRFAQAVVTARLAPDSYNNDPSKVMLGAMAAMEAGLPPLYGLRQIAIINGRPTIWGDAAMALIQASGQLADRIVTELGGGIDTDTVPRNEWPDSFGYMVQLFRRGQSSPYIGRFTIADAKRAKLWDDHRRQPWQNHPKRMLLVRAQTIAQRDGFADCLAGLAIREEVEDTHGAEKAEVATSFLDDTPPEETETAELVETRDLGGPEDLKADF